MAGVGELEPFIVHGRSVAHTKQAYYPLSSLGNYRRGAIVTKYSSWLKLFGPRYIAQTCSYFPAIDQSIKLTRLESVGEVRLSAERP